MILCVQKYSSFQLLFPISYCLQSVEKYLHKYMNSISVLMDDGLTLQYVWVYYISYVMVHSACLR